MNDADEPLSPAPASPAQIVDPAALAPDLAADVQARFVEVLAQWGNVRAAAAQAGVSRAHLYRMRRASPEFRRLWDAALVLARPQVEEVLADRALNGVAETVYYRGEEVATRVRYDTRLLLAHLHRLDRIESTHEVRRAVSDFDARVEELRFARPPVDWDEIEDDECFTAEDGPDDDDWQDEEDDDACNDGTDAPARGG